MNQGKTSASDSKDYHPNSLIKMLKKRKIIATLAFFVGFAEPRFKKLMERVKHEWENFEV